MSTQKSSVLVAVRVRPFSSRESPFECTVTVEDGKTIALTDVGTVDPSSGTVSGSMQRHVFTFDKIFWSIPHDILPLAMSPGRRCQHSAPVCLPKLTATDSSISPHSPSGESISVRRSSNSSDTSAAVSHANTDAQNAVSGGGGNPSFCRLPCFAPVPNFDDQDDVYKFIGPVMYDSVMTGYNSCLFAYGQTGSGKTHSMLGSCGGSPLGKGENAGVVQRLCEDLFEMMRRDREQDEGVSYNVECSFFEIYCERVQDLLVHTKVNESCDAGWAPSPPTGSASCSDRCRASPSQSMLLTSHNCFSPPHTSQLRIRQHPTRGPYVENLSSVKVRSVEGVMYHLNVGMRERATAETRMNERSSRSHALLQLNITRVSVVREEGAVITNTRMCKVSLVDLAGSERIAQSGATGDRFEEARNINLSLTTLTRVIMQLTEKQAGKNVVPSYRDSALTWLLSDSLGGNSKTIMLATVAPSSFCYQQTLNTLRFAGVAKKVINVATVNEDHRFQKLITSLREQVLKLTMQLEEGKGMETQMNELKSLRHQNVELRELLEGTRHKLSKMVPRSELNVIQRRVTECEADNTRLHKEKSNLQRQLMTITVTNREELLKKRAEITKLQESLAKKDVEIQDLRRRHRSEMARYDFSATQLASHISKGRSAAVEGILSPTSALRSKYMMCNSSTISAEESPKQCSLSGDIQCRQQQLDESMGKLKSEITSDKKRRGKAEKVSNKLRSELAALKNLHKTTSEQLEETCLKLAEKSHALDVAKSDLASLQSLVAAERSGELVGGMEDALAGQLESLRVEYLQEKQTNVNLLMQVSRAGEQLFLLQKMAEEKGNDIIELEQMLLEETETSERYYIFQLCYQGRAEIYEAIQRRLLFAKGTHFMGVNNGVNGTEGLSYDNIGFATNGQTISGCVQQEAYERLQLKEEWSNGVYALITQGSFVLKILLSKLNEELFSLRGNAVEVMEEKECLGKKLERAENALQEADAVRRALQMDLSSKEEALVGLGQQVNDMKEELQLQRQRNEALIAKLAEAQAARDVRDDIVEGESDVNTSSDEFSKHPRSCGENEGANQMNSAALRDQVLRHKKQIDALNAQLEGEQNARLQLQLAMERTLQLKQEELQCVKDDCRVSLLESARIVRDFKARINELNDTICSLRNSAVEEGETADRVRDELLKLKVAYSDLSSKLQNSTESKSEFQSSVEDAVRRLHAVEQIQQQLGRDYDSMELRLNDIYGLLGVEGCPGAKYEDGDRTWLEEAIRRKGSIEQQKHAIRKLSGDLLEAVAERRASLRDMGLQIAFIQGISAQYTDAAHLPGRPNSHEG
uniref:WGS project CAEQ00000000 data, annotated contig 899 n=1 Tax=Trypanosoma congolense (strain IL3000) TaxID=1068625 RepID=F9WJD6_TRYCI|nr:unnamed protein product [Trypanosoma congolense IL3000]